MKLSPLLAQYLTTNKELNLSGIGRFTLHLTEEAEPDSDKQPKPFSPGNIQFQQNISLKEDETLIAFIATQSGKMKSLAAADLNSHLELARQFLNIGKPFLFEGIGTLTKNKAGQFEFVQGPVQNEKLKENQAQNIDQSSTTENSFTDYEDMLSPKKRKTPFARRAVLWLALLGGIGLAVLGGYLVFSRSSSAKEAPLDETQTTTVLIPHSSLIKRDSMLPSTPAPGSFRFIVEQATRNRALLRFHKLKSYGVDIKMDTKDSIRFKLYFLLKATPADTARIRDSLGLLYSTAGKPVVE